MRVVSRLLASHLAMNPYLRGATEGGHPPLLKSLNFLPCTLVVFSRYPEPGIAKTRLIPDIGALSAAQVQQEMAELVFRVAENLQLTLDVHCMIAYSGDGIRMQQWAGPTFSLVPQVVGDLGQKMKAVFLTELEQKRQKILLVGTDCPQLTTEILEGDFASLMMSIWYWGRHAMADTIVLA